MSVFLVLVLPSAPRNVTITFVNQSAVEISWQLPEITGHQTRVFYDVDCRKPCDSDAMCMEEYCDRVVNYM